MTTPPDESIQLHSAPHRLREVEIVWELIEQLPYKPRDILVLAPDIQPYVASIEWVGKQRKHDNYTVRKIEAKTNCPLLQGIETFLSLPRFQFSKEIFEKLLLCPAFQQRFDLSLEESLTISRWLNRPNIFNEISVVDAPLLSRWIEITTKIEHCFSILSIKQSPLEWANWLDALLTTFFCIDEQKDLFTPVLATLRNQRIVGKFPYTTIEKLLSDVIIHRSGVIQQGNLQAIRFSSLIPGSLTPAKAIMIMGLQEGNFPRSHSFSFLPTLPLVNRAEEDRALFLEAVALAQDRFIMTYTRCHPEDGKEMHPSSVVRELIKDRKEVLTFHHQKSAYLYPS